MYKIWHNNQEAAIHHSICHHYKINTKENVWLNTPKTVVKNNKVHLLPDFDIQLDRYKLGDVIY